MKNFKKGLFVGLPIGGALMIAISLAFMNLFPDAILDNTSVITLLFILALLTFVLYMLFNIKSHDDRYDKSCEEFILSEPVEIIIDYSGKNEFHNHFSASASAINWADKKSNKIVKRKAYLADLCSEEYLNLALKMLKEKGFTPATITELSFYPEALSKGRIIGLGSVSKDEATDMEMTSFLAKDGTIQRTWLRAKCFEEDRFLVFKDEETDVVVILDKKDDELPSEANDKAEEAVSTESKGEGEAAVSVKVKDESPGEPIKKSSKENPYDEPESFNGLGM